MCPLKTWWLTGTHLTSASPLTTKWWTPASLPPGRQWTPQRVRRKIFNWHDTDGRKKNLCPSLFPSAPCGGSFKGDQGEIISPNWPSDYHGQSVCTWRITAPTGKTVHVAFTDFELQAVNMLGKCVDYVEILNGDSMASLGWLSISSVGVCQQCHCLRSCCHFAAQ